MARSRSGSVYERRPGVWECRVTSGGATARSVVRGTEADAWADVRRLEATLGKVPPLGREATLRAVWDAYRASRGQRLAAKTLANYEWHMERVVLPALGGRPAWSLSHADVQALLLTPGWSRDRAARVRRVLSSVLSWAEGAGHVSSNVARGSFELPADPDALDGIDEADDPFAVIEGARSVWGAQTVMEAMPRLRGCALEPCWLACVGAGLRVEEALALRRADIRRIDIGGRMVTQLAVHHATPDAGGRGATKTPRSVRVVAVAEPMGARLWEIAEAVAGRTDPLCTVSASSQNRAWRLMFEPAPESWHPRMAGSRMSRGRLHGLPYVPLSRMRATHATLMQEAGVSDSVASAVQGHSERVAYSNYQRPELTEAAERVGERLTLVS